MANVSVAVALGLGRGRRRGRWRQGLGAMALVLLSACGGGESDGSGEGGSTPPIAETPPAPAPSPVPDPASGFQLFPARPTLAVGDDGLLLAQTPPGPLVWSSSDPGVASVDESGRLKALSKGSTTVSAVSGTAVATATLTVYRTTGPNPDPSSEALIAQALAAGRISPEQALGYRVLALFGDSRLPAEFVGAPGELPDHMLLREVSGQLPTLSKASQDLLLPFLIPPIYAESRFSQLRQAPASKAARLSADRKLPLADITVNCDLPRFSGATRTTEHFKIWGYFGDGALGGDDGRPTAETFTDFIASVVEEIYRSETDLFKRFPLTDANEPCNGGDGKVDIYLSPLDMAGRMPAQTVAYPNRCEKVPAYIVLNPIAMTLDLGRATVAFPLARNKQKWKSVIAHEFLHVLQFAMDRQAGCADYKWFDEATATWVMDHVEPQANFEDGGGAPASNGFARRQGKFYMNYLYNDHRVSIETASPESNPELNGYGDYLFIQYLARNHQPETIAQIFDATIGLASVEAIASVLDTKGGMKRIWPEFATTLWNDDVGKVLDYWSTQDNYDIGLAAIYSPTAAPTVASTKLKTLQLDQLGQPRASFKLFDNALVDDHYEFQPRSVLYEHLKFSDTTVHSVYFSNAVAAFPNREFMKVQAKMKIGGQWQAVEDWTGEPFKQFCLDRSSERIEELLLIVSNSEVNRGTERPFQIPKVFPMQISTSNVGCWLWQGQAQTTVIGGTPSPIDSISRATGLFLVVKSLLPGRIIFGSSGGTVGGNSTVTLGPGCTATGVGDSLDLYRGLGSEHLPGDDTVVDIDLDLDLGFSQLGGDPPDRKLVALSGFSFLNTTNTVLCPPVNQVSTGSQGWEWLHVDDPAQYSVSADGQTIEGRFTATLPNGAVLDSQWKFTAMKE